MVVGNTGPLSLAIAMEAAKRVQELAVAWFPPRQVEPPFLPLEWNPSSPISAKSLVLGAQNRLGKIDEAILVCAPPALRKDLAQVSPQELDSLMDDHIKGWWYLARELVSALRSRKAGTLALVLSEAPAQGNKDDPEDLMGPVIGSAFRSLAQGLLASSYADPFRTLAFSTTDVGDDGAYAAFVYKIIDEDNKRNSGKWHKYGKVGLFGR